VGVGGTRGKTGFGGFTSVKGEWESGGLHTRGLVAMSSRGQLGETKKERNHVRWGGDMYGRWDQKNTVR